MNAALVPSPARSFRMTAGLYTNTAPTRTSSRIEKTVQPVPGSHSFVYHIGIRSAEDIDSEIKGWIRQSYEYSKLNYA